MSNTAVCIDCGESPADELFGVPWCEAHMPESQPLDVNAWYELIYKPSMERLFQARGDGLEATKARVLAELRSNGNVSKSS